MASRLATLAFLMVSLALVLAAQARPQKSATCHPKSCKPSELCTETSGSEPASTKCSPCQPLDCEGTCSKSCFCGRSGYVPEPTGEPVFAPEPTAESVFVPEPTGDFVFCDRRTSYCAADLGLGRATYKCIRFGS